MPEGPEVRREADLIARALVGAPLTRVEYRMPALARAGRRLAGARVDRVYVRGKALLIAFDTGVTHYSHNQLYGQWRVLRAGAAFDDGRAVRVVLATAARIAVLYSATDVALLSPAALVRHPYLARLGPDALARETTMRTIAERVADPRFARSSLAALLLSQAFVAGLGNYLRSEILFAARLAPELRAGELSPAQRASLAKAIFALPRLSYRTGGVTNDPALARAEAAAGVAFADFRFLVYGRAGQPCRACGTAIVRRDAAGCGLFACPSCQRPGGAEGRRARAR
ncbi:MAG: endonuclease VIII [Burkholderiales bacterium]